MRHAALLVLLCGCARFTTTQQDLRYKDGLLIDTITTRVTVNTFFDGKSSLANFKAMQTEKTQSAVVGALSQETTPTNSVQALQAIVRILELVRPTP